MLIPFSQIVRKYNTPIRGIVHVGAHIGQEVPDYKAQGVDYMILIEPCQSQFAQLVQKYGGIQGIHFIKVACGAEEGVAQMNVETHNGGQSNSLLKPGTHLNHYPMIKFENTEEVRVLPLLAIQNRYPTYNFLNIDVQGFELEVLKGADITQFDFIYTEVNREEVYQGAPKIEEIDSYLSKHFVRVETKWTGQGWGDALYVRKDNRLAVPDIFKPKSTMVYPPDNIVPFEQYFASLPCRTAFRTHVPIMWTNYLNNAMRRTLSGSHHLKTLQDFVDSIPRVVDGVTQKYFTVCQHDDGPSVDFKDLDIVVFGMGGGKMDVTLPLVCAPHKVQHPRMERLLVSSFVGNITHQVRSKMFTMFHADKSGLHYVTNKPHGINAFCGVLQKSIFTLCPRGYGPTSFRIAEALQYGSIPVYIFDQEALLPQIPYGFQEYGIICESQNIAFLPNALVDLSKDLSRLHRLRETGGVVYNNFYRFEGLRQHIFNLLDNR